jgi:RNA polymerase sigma-70 factor (ECF subfamily)
VSASDDLGPRLYAARAGDAEAQGELLGRYRSWLLVLAEGQLGRRLPGKCDASDLVQQTMLAACRDLPNFRGATGQELRAWLRHILAHALGHELRRYAGTERRDAGREVSIDQTLDQSSQRMAEMLAAPDSSPSRQAGRREDELRLADALARLPVHYRTVIVLRNLEGLTHAEVAGRMGRGVGDVRMLWVRALARLRRELVRVDAPDDSHANS